MAAALQGDWYFGQPTEPLLVDGGTILDWIARLEKSSVP
jgi:hypothetical protein